MRPVREPGWKPKPTSLIVLLTLLLLLMLAVAYVGVMHALVDISRPEHDIDRRDTAYTYVHLVMLLGAAIIGFLAGRWFNGLGVAFATLFVVALLVAMLTVQLTSYELACHGHNDLVRHWQC
jgi:hypothetical protein